MAMARMAEITITNGQRNFDTRVHMYDFCFKNVLKVNSKAEIGHAYIAKSKKVNECSQPSQHTDSAINLPE